MKFAFVCFLLIVGSFCKMDSALAVQSQFDFACLGIDGVPISYDSALAGPCCVNRELRPNPPETCRAGFNSIGAGAATNAAVSVNLAQQTLGVAKSLNGANAVYTDPTPSPEKGKQDTSPSSTSALTSGGSGSASGAGSGSGGKDNGAGAARTGSKEGSSAGASSQSSGLSLGTSSGDSAKKSGSSASGNEMVNSPDSAGGYAKAGNGSGGDSEKNGLGGLSLSGLFGKDGSTGAGGKNENGAGNGLNFDGENSENGAKNDPDGMSGTSVDPPDYFTRIDQTASLFKIVTKRYVKEILRQHVGRVPLVETK